MHRDENTCTLVQGLARNGDGALDTRHARLPPRRAGFNTRPGSPDFRKWDPCRTMPLVGLFFSGISVSPAPSFRRHSIFTSITFINSQDLAVERRPNLFILHPLLRLSDTGENNARDHCQVAPVGKALNLRAAPPLLRSAVQPWHAAGSFRVQAPQVACTARGFSPRVLVTSVKQDGLPMLCLVVRMASGGHPHVCDLPCSLVGRGKTRRRASRRPMSNLARAERRCFTWSMGGKPEVGRRSPLRVAVYFDIYGVRQEKGGSEQWCSERNKGVPIKATSQEKISFFKKALSARQDAFKMLYPGTAYRLTYNLTHSKAHAFIRDSNPEPPAPQIGGAPIDCATKGRLVQLKLSQPQVLISEQFPATDKEEWGVEKFPVRCIIYGQTGFNAYVNKPLPAGPPLLRTSPLNPFPKENGATSGTALCRAVIPDWNGVAVALIWTYPFADWLREALEKDLVCDWLSCAAEEYLPAGLELPILSTTAVSVAFVSVFPLAIVPLDLAILVTPTTRNGDEYPFSDRPRKALGTGPASYWLPRVLRRVPCWLGVASGREQEDLKKTRRPVALSGTIPTRETLGATPPGIEPSSSRRTTESCDLEVRAATEAASADARRLAVCVCVSSQGLQGPRATLAGLFLATRRRSEECNGRHARTLFMRSIRRRLCRITAPETSSLLSPFVLTSTTPIQQTAPRAAIAETRCEKQQQKSPPPASMRGEDQVRRLRAGVHLMTQAARMSRDEVGRTCPLNYRRRRSESPPGTPSTCHTSTSLRRMT
ncbi:hypothetical protein PR048_027146 [Dryococelus australis]|uniref:Uncharacterized protein n=1 Tax=Dryococelus australis TaxID=614101 RepID=A0ABQ9GEM2_9NEOP|nr:hypothetical protein PR048_027146 [Dryococelus australis]